MLRFATFALLGLLVATGTPSPLSAKATPDPIAAVNYFGDPGPEPPVVPLEYDAYRRYGTSSISGLVNWPVSDDTGSEYNVGDVDLYPNTAYVRWILETWAREVDGKHMLWYLGYPGAPGTGIKLPPYLDSFGSRNDGMPPALRESSVNGFSFAFTQLPPGNYLLVLLVQRVETHSRYESGQVIVESPYGEYPMESGGQEYNGGSLGEGYILTTVRPLVVEANHNYTLDSKYLTVVAHFMP